MAGFALLAPSRAYARSSPPVTRRVAQCFVADETPGDSLASTTQLLAAGLTVTMDHLGEDVTTAIAAAANAEKVAAAASDADTTITLDSKDSTRSTPP